MMACSAARSTSVTKSLRPLLETRTRSRSRLARLMIEPALRAAFTAVFSIGCIEGKPQTMQAPDSIDTGDVAADTAALDRTRVRFVLVEPSHCGNIGAAARAIRTMGFCGLSVVAPRDSSYRASGEAVALAANARFESLNLAQAVQVTAYEMRCALSAPHDATPAQLGGAPVESVERLFIAIEQALTAIGFHDPQQPKHSMARLRSLLAR